MFPAIISLYCIVTSLELVLLFFLFVTKDVINENTHTITNIIKMMNQQVKVLVLSNDISASQEKKYLSKANYYNVKVIHFISKQEMGELFNKNEVACVGINDINMAKEIIKLAQ